MFYINAQIGYYTGDRISPDDLEVPERPSQFHEYVNGAWVLNAEKLHESIWVNIKAERDRRLQQCGYKVGDHWFHSDTFSRTQQVALTILGANIPPGTLWKTMSGEFVPMTQSLANQIFAAAALSDIAIFGKAEFHRSNVQESNTPDQYEYLTDWPTGYGE